MWIELISKPLRGLCRIGVKIDRFSQAVNNKNNITAYCLSVEVAVEVAGMMLFFFEMKWL